MTRLLGLLVVITIASIAIAGTDGASVALAASGITHPFDGNDWQRLASAVPRAVAADGRTILIEETHGRPKGTDVHVWYTLGADGRGRRLLHLPKSFEPFGFTRSAHELYGTLDVKDRPQVARWTIGARKAHVIATVAGSVSAIVPSRDFARFALIADPRAPDPLADTRTVVTNDENALFVVSSTGGTPQRWCPTLDQIGGLAWSPDGTRIAVLSQTPKIGYHHVSGRVDLCGATSAKNLAQIHNAVLNEIPYPGAGIAWADGGTELAFLSTTTDVITPDHLWTVPVAGGPARDRTPDITTSVLALRGDPFGHVWTTIANGVQTEVGSYSGGILRRAFVLRDGTLDLPVTPDIASAPPRLVFDRTDPAHTRNVAVAEHGALLQLTHVGDDTLSHVALGHVIRHRWTSADGIALEAIVTFPPGYSRRPGKFVVLPHGGPEANDELRFDALARLVAARGYVVMQPQYRGSTGYGSAHLQAIYQHFGDTAYRDVDAATTEAIAQGWADPKRLAIFGWSAGGFMTSWTITQTQRYRAAVEGAGITEWLSFITASDVQQTDYDARPLEAGAQPFLQYSAVMFADRVTTPLLILHGAADERVPTYQGREFFILLKERGKVVRMVTYPGSPHFPRKWEQRRNVADELTHWLDHYDP